MVRIYCNREKLELQIDGHANSAEYGKDLVCCAVSILAESLSRYLDRKEEAGELRYLVNEIAEGRVYISADPCRWDLKETVGAFEVIREGLKAIAEEYPEYIKMEEA